MFFRTADEDYLAARMLWHHGLSNGFCWSAAQSLEKYIKSALLLNGLSAKSLGHSLSTGFDELQSKASGLLPGHLFLPSKVLGQIPTNMLPVAEVPIKETFAATLDRFAANGDTAQRYGERGHYLDLFDLHRVDLMCFFSRRLCVDLESKENGVRLGDYLATRPEMNWKFLEHASMHVNLNAGESFQNNNYAFFLRPPNLASVVRKSERYATLLQYKDDNTAEGKAARQYLDQHAKVTTFEEEKREKKRKDKKTQQARKSCRHIDPN